MLQGLLRALAFVVRVLFPLLVLLLLWRALRRILQGPQRGGHRGGRVVTGTMVRDPVCGMHVASELAIKDTRGGRTIYFCSETCRQLYLGRS